MLGASGAVMAVVSLYTLYNPRREFSLHLPGPDVAAAGDLHRLRPAPASSAVRGSRRRRRGAPRAGRRSATCSRRATSGSSRLEKLLPPQAPAPDRLGRAPREPRPPGRTVGPVLVARPAASARARRRRPSSPRSSSTPGSTRSSPRSPAKARAPDRRREPHPRGGQPTRPEQPERADLMADLDSSATPAPATSTHRRLQRPARPRDRGQDARPGVLARGVTPALADPDRLRYWVAEDDRRRPGRRPGGDHPRVERLARRLDLVVPVRLRPPRPRGRGVFRALHAHIRARSPVAADVIGLRLYVEAANDRAQRVYQSLGMKPGGYDVYEDLWIASPDGADRELNPAGSGRPIDPSRLARLPLLRSPRARRVPPPAQARRPGRRPSIAAPRWPGPVAIRPGSPAKSPELRARSRRGPRPGGHSSRRGGRPNSVGSQVRSSISPARPQSPGRAVEPDLVQAAGAGDDGGGGSPSRAAAGHEVGLPGSGTPIS